VKLNLTNQKLVELTTKMTLQLEDLEMRSTKKKTTSSHARLGNLPRLEIQTMKAFGNP